MPKKESGNASRMGHLVGVTGISAPRQLEVLPYTLSRAEFVEPGAANNPFNDGSRMFGGAGLDLKFGLTSNFTLSATINPDFGQVEVDPAVVNLTAFETFFPERRPFFVEGSQIFQNIGRSGANSLLGTSVSRAKGRRLCEKTHCRRRDPLVHGQKYRDKGIRASGSRKRLFLGELDRGPPSRKLRRTTFAWLANRSSRCRWQACAVLPER